MPGRKPNRIVLRLEERKALRAHLQTGKTEWRVVRRARVLLDIDAGKNPCEIAEAVGCDPATVWRLGKRFLERGLEAVHDAPRSGRPPEISPPRQSAGG